MDRNKGSVDVSPVREGQDKVLPDAVVPDKSENNNVLDEDPDHFTTGPDYPY